MSANGWPYEVGEKSQLYRAGADSPATIKNDIAMKKESVKKQIDAMLETAEEVFWTKTETDLELAHGNFRGWYGIKPGDVESRRIMEEHLRKRAAEVSRGHVISRAEMERRSNNFQKALAYIGEHRHLIPFFRFLYDWTHEHPDKSVQDGIREYRKAHKVLPSELIGESGWGRSTYYHLGTKQPELATIIAQIPVLPKAWML